jgi:uncharacterized protein YdeI (YjbR/CyaY-like superfamily)
MRRSRRIDATSGTGRRRPVGDAMKRPRHPMPDDIAALLDEQGLRGAYDARPPYQRNDWLGWIAAAKRPETRQKRLHSMVRELEAGEGYMGMAWTPRDRR